MESFQHQQESLHEADSLEESNTNHRPRITHTNFFASPANSPNKKRAAGSPSNGSSDATSASTVPIVGARVESEMNLDYDYNSMAWGEKRGGSAESWDSL